MDILSILPLLSGWSYVRVSGSTSLVESTTVYKSDDTMLGWLIGAVLHTNEPTAGLEVDVYTSGGQGISYYLVPNYLLSNGLTQPNHVAPFLAKYDQANNDYEAVFEPTVPFPIYGQVEVKLIASSSPADVYYDAHLISIDDVESFMNSITSVLGITSIQQLLTVMDRYLHAMASRGQATGIKIETPLPEVPTFNPNKNYEGFIP